MSLMDDLAAEKISVEEVGYVPRIEFDGSSGVWETGVIRGEVPQDFGPLFREALQDAGENPDRIRLGSVLKQSHWQQRSKGETVWLHAFKFSCLHHLSSNVDIEGIVKRAKKAPAAATGPHWFVFQASDLQIGKRSRDGSTEEIVERYVDSVELAKKQFNSLKRHGIEGIQISMPGDCVEGVVSQNSKNLWLTQEPITEQIRILRRLMMHTVEELAPLTNKIYLDVVNGNHDEAMRVQNTYPGNGWATECAIQVRDALTLNERAYGHVEVRIPNKWSGMMTVPVGDSVVCIVHGHQWRAAGAMKWWAEQAINGEPPGAAQILQNGHYHEFAIQSNSKKIRVQSATYDCGSDWFRNEHGCAPRRGGLTYLLQAGNLSYLTMV